MHVSNGPQAQYFAALASGEFLIQRCDNCDTAIFYPRILCSYCGSTHLAWIKPCGRGTVYSATTVRRDPEKGGDYNVSLIDLAEGVRIMSRVVGMPPDSVTIGMKVEFSHIDEETQDAINFRKAAGG